MSAIYDLNDSTAVQRTFNGFRSLATGRGELRARRLDLVAIFGQEEVELPEACDQGFPAQLLVLAAIFVTRSS